MFGHVFDYLRVMNGEDTKFDATFRAKIVIEALEKGLEKPSHDYGISPEVIEVWTREFIMDSVNESGRKAGRMLFPFMEDIIKTLTDMGKPGTAVTYRTTLSSFRNYRKGEDISFDDLNSDVLKAYEAYLSGRGVSPNSSSFYMRILRATYNRAVEKGLTVQRQPFRHVYTGVEKTVKRALPIRRIKQIKELDLHDRPAMEFARDMFLFSFYTRGMSFVDMAYLKKKDLKDNSLTYRRRKTGQLLTVKWEKGMQRIYEKYMIKDSDYMLPIITSQNTDARKQYIYAAHSINRYLKIIGEMIGLDIPLTMYVSRHSWASIAKSKNIPISVISQGMGHDSEKTTLIYLATLDTVAVDKANSLIINSL